MGPQLRGEVRRRQEDPRSEPGAQEGRVLGGRPGRAERKGIHTVGPEGRPPPGAHRGRGPQAGEEGPRGGGSASCTRVNLRRGRRLRHQAQGATSGTEAKLPSLPPPAPGREPREVSHITLQDSVITRQALFSRSRGRRPRTTPRGTWRALSRNAGGSGTLQTKNSDRPHVS